MPVSNLPEIQALSETAALALCRMSFPEFLTWCQVRSDDPQQPGDIRLIPWPYQQERAKSWQEGNSEVILKERQLGFSAALIAPYLLWRSMYHGWACGYLSVGQEEAREEIRRIKRLHEQLPPYLKIHGQIRVDDASFEGGGRIIAFPSTEHAGISYTLQLVVFDEAAFHPYGSQNYTAIQPAAARGQFIILSTADPELGPSGFFHDIYFASKEGNTPYTAVFEARRRPDRDADWYIKAKKAYIGHEHEFDAYYPETDSGAFVARSGLVYPQFTPERHVKEEPFALSSCRRIVAGVDFGGGDPTAIVILGMDEKQHVHQFAEFYETGSIGVDALGAFISKYPVDTVMCDPTQGTSIATLKETWRVNARKANNNRGDGMGLVAFLLDNDRLTISPSCVNSIAEFTSYRWAARTDPNDKRRYATTAAVNHHADAHDARRYATAELLSMLMPHTSLPSFTLAGKRMSRTAV